MNDGHSSPSSPSEPGPASPLKNPGAGSRAASNSPVGPEAEGATSAPSAVPPGPGTGPDAASSRPGAPGRWRAGAITAGLVALLTAPFLWFRLDPDFRAGTVALAFAPANGARFLAGLLPAVVATVVGLALAWSRRRLPRLLPPLPAALRTRTAAAGLLVLLAALSFALGHKGLSMAVFVGLYMMLALGLNITVGMTGLLVLGYSAFFAIGAYTLALLQQALPWVTWWMALPAAFAVGSAAGWLVGLPCLRLRGDYLAIVTLGFAEGLREILRNLRGLTGGDNGIILGFGAKIQAIGPIPAIQAAYLWTLAFVAVAIALVWRLYHSPVGRAWIAIREDEIAAGAMGVPTVRMKLLAFSVSAGAAAVPGVLFAAFTGFVDPAICTFEESVLVLAMVILGGLGSIPGALLGAALLYLIPALLRDWMPSFADFRLLFFGAILVAMMLHRPQGLLGSARHRLEMEGQE